MECQFLNCVFVSKFLILTEILKTDVERDVNLFELTHSADSDLDQATLKRFSTRQITLMLSLNPVIKGIYSYLIVH